MKRVARYQLNFASKWLIWSGVAMGLAFFLQALDFFALRTLQDVPVWELVLFLILPMVLEAIWCVPLRSEAWHSAQSHGVFAALICLVLLGQAILSGGFVSVFLAVVFCLLSGAAAVLITFGFIPRRALGMLVLAAAAAVQVLLFALPQYVADPSYPTLVQEVPPVCMILSVMLFFGGIRKVDTEEIA